MATPRLVVPFASLLVACSGGDDIAAQQEDATAAPTTTLTFDAEWNESASGPLVAGGKALIAYDYARLSDCRGEKNGNPAWAITGFYKIDDGSVQQLSIFSLMTQGSEPRPLALDQPGHLEMWFQVHNVWGCMDWDSNLSDNYHFEIEPPKTFPSWAGNAVSVISRQTCAGMQACPQDYQPLGDGFTYGTWARQRATIAQMEFEAWEPGVTDWENPELWQALDTQMHVSIGGAAYTSQYVDFQRRTDHNARFATSIRALDPLDVSAPIAAEDCPSGLTTSPDGYYASIGVELYFTINEVELRPAPNKTFKARFENYRELFAACLP